MWTDRHDEANKCFHGYSKMPKMSMKAQDLLGETWGKSDKNSAWLHDNHNKKSDLGTL
jgi:hypothetical protein